MLALLVSESPQVGKGPTPPTALAHDGPQERSTHGPSQRANAKWPRRPHTVTRLSRPHRPTATPSAREGASRPRQRGATRSRCPRSPAHDFPRASPTGSWPGPLFSRPRAGQCCGTGGPRVSRCDGTAPWPPCVKLRWITAKEMVHWPSGRPKGTSPIQRTGGPCISRFVCQCAAPLPPLCACRLHGASPSA